jgi:hypothetical protein
MSVSIAVLASTPQIVEQLATVLEASGYRVAARAVTRTRKPDLAAQLKSWCSEPAMQLVIGVNGATARAALLPLITKRLSGFTDLRDIDGGQCGSTIVVLVPKAFTLQTLEPILARIEHADAPRRRGPTQPPPPPRAGTSTSSIIATRQRPKTAPPPVPVREEPDFIIEYKPSAEREFAEQVAAIRPIRLEPVSLTVSPIPPALPVRRYRKWMHVAAAIVCGALVGIVMRAARSSPASGSAHSATSQAPTAAPERPIASAADDVEIDSADVTDLEVIDMGEEVDDPIEMPALRMRKRAKIPLWKLFTDKPVRRVASRTRKPVTARAPSTAKCEQIHVMSAAQLWISASAATACDPITCAVHNLADACCDRFRMTECKRSLDLAHPTLRQRAGR